MRGDHSRKPWLWRTLPELARQSRRSGPRSPVGDRILRCRDLRQRRESGRSSGRAAPELEDLRLGVGAGQTPARNVGRVHYSLGKLLGAFLLGR